jgi:O-antigen/teichoic acid export membrane protein
MPEAVSADARPHDAVPAPDAPGSLRRRVLSAGSITLGLFAWSQVLRLAVNLVLARLLVPDVFAVMAIATVVNVVVSLLSDIGLRQGVIHSPRGDAPAMLHTAWTLQVMRGAGIWLVCCAIAAAVGAMAAMGLFPEHSVYAVADLPWVIVGMSSTSLIQGFQPAKIYLAHRALMIHRPVAIEACGQLLGACITLVLAWHFRSIWAFVAGALAAAGLQLALSLIWLPGPRDRFLLDRGAVAELLGYGRWVLLSSLLYVLAANGDKLLLGAWIDATSLGLYSIAFSLASMVEVAAGRLLSSVAMPALSEVARTDRTRLRDTYFRLRRPIDFGFLAASGLLYALGPPLIGLMYDQRYVGAGPMLQTLSLSLILARYGLAGSVYMAVGEPRNLTVIHLVKLASLMALLPLGFHLFGLQGALFAVALFALPTLPIVFYYNVRLGVNDWWYELRILWVWPAALAAGWALRAVLTWF